MEEVRETLNRMVVAANRRREKEVKAESWSKVAVTEAYRDGMQFALHLIELQIRREKGE